MNIYYWQGDHEFTVKLIVIYHFYYQFLCYFRRNKKLFLYIVGNSAYQILVLYLGSYANKLVKKSDSQVTGINNIPLCSIISSCAWVWLLMHDRNFTIIGFQMWKLGFERGGAYLKFVKFISDYKGFCNWYFSLF